MKGKGNMERLTETNNCIGFMETYLNVNCKECQYKDTAECEEFKDECRAVADFKSCVKNMYSKLKEYEDLEEQGKLLKLPVAVGNTVYRVHAGTELSPDRIYECRVVGEKQEYNTLSVKLHANINEETYSIWVDDWFDRCQIGYEFFLTKEAAEAALKEMSE